MNRHLISNAIYAKIHSTILLFLQFCRLANDLNNRNSLRIVENVEQNTFKNTVCGSQFSVVKSLIFLIFFLFFIFFYKELVEYAKAIDVVLHTHGDQPGTLELLKSL